VRGRPSLGRRRHERFDYRPFHACRIVCVAKPFAPILPLSDFIPHVVPPSFFTTRQNHERLIALGGDFALKNDFADVK